MKPNTSSSPSSSWNKKTSTSTFKSSSYRLLAARFVQRPQLKFVDKIDNTDTPFVPKIKHKPHALKSLEESLKVDMPEEMKELADYPHPYQYELDHYSPTKVQCEKVEPQFPKSYAETPFTMITTEIGMKNLISDLKEVSEIAVDVEHHSYRTYQGITCLIQISTRWRDYIIDTLELRKDMHLLNDIFTDPQIVKVFHGADSDIEWLQRDFGVYVVNMFDTGQASRVLNLPRYGLAYLLDTYCNVQADKQYQLADWRIRPLPSELVQYAREDTHYLLYIYDKVKNMLIDRGNEQKNLLHSVLQRSVQLCTKRYKKSRLTNDSCMETYRRTKKMFNARQMACYKKLYSWRDKIARNEDESTGYVLPNHMLLQIAEILPRESQGVLACCNPIPPLVRQCLNEIHEVVLHCRDLPLTKSVSSKSSSTPVTRYKLYNVERLLNCPHDTSHHRSSVMPDTSIDTSLISTNSTMFRSDPTTVHVKSPLISIFEHTSSKKPSEAHRKASIIRASFVSPFEKYLPPPRTNYTTMTNQSQPSHKDQQKTTEKVQTINENWKLLSKTNTSQVKVVCQSEEKEKVPDNQEDKHTDEESIPLRKQLGSKKKRKSTSKQSGDKTVKKKKQKIEDVLSEFKTYDYSQQDIHIFQAKPESSRKGKKQHYDQNIEADIIKGGKKSKGPSQSSKKSYTYSKTKDTDTKNKRPKR